jgi:RNA polymerase sigma-70 factor, ECF subfamily
MHTVPVQSHSPATLTSTAAPTGPAYFEGAFDKTAQALLNQHRDYLFRFAMKKVRDPDVADDLVQDTLMAALQAKATADFKGQSTYRVWLVGILKHKILDSYRERSRYVSLSQDDDGDEPNHADNRAASLDEVDSRLASDPQRATAMNQLLARVDVAMRELPQGVAEVFIAKEIHGETTESLSQRLGISADNVWVRVHRARKALLQRLNAAGALEGMTHGRGLVMA